MIRQTGFYSLTTVGRFVLALFTHIGFFSSALSSVYRMHQSPQTKEGCCWICRAGSTDPCNGVGLAAWRSQSCGIDWQSRATGGVERLLLEVVIRRPIRERDALCLLIRSRPSEGDSRRQISL